MSVFACCALDGEARLADVNCHGYRQFSWHKGLTAVVFDHDQ